ncbi:hypothetical protein AMECASPLE_030664 [Ameca splendens]|uniref:Uncharacterized protein n=1 Tax=Ameca splendens TaxID=208324 RepID=A0ABV0XV14_9TELE
MLYHSHFHQRAAPKHQAVLSEQIFSGFRRSREIFGDPVWKHSSSLWDLLETLTGEMRRYTLKALPVGTPSQQRNFSLPQICCPVSLWLGEYILDIAFQMQFRVPAVSSGPHSGVRGEKERM